MAKISIKLIDGSVFECDDIDLNSCSNRDLIQLMINEGCIIPEEELPVRNEQGDHMVYTLIAKSGSGIINPIENKSLAEIGFVDGDIIRIIPTTTRKSYGQMATLTIKLLTEAATCIVFSMKEGINYLKKVDTFVTLRLING